MNDTSDVAVSERLFAWLQRFRRLVTHYEHHIENFLGRVNLGCMRIMLKVFVSDYW
jgi:transposase